jgi:D-alanyl-D-alanine carboxypeptidase
LGRALFTGEVFGEDMQALMLDFVPAAGNIRGEPGAGLGIRKYSYLGREQWGHSGGSPAGSSLLFFDPDSGVTVAVLMNQGRGAEHFTLAPRLLSIATSAGIGAP